MGKWFRLGFVAACLVVGSIGCQRDGFECSTDADCFDQEVCSAGTCSQAEACTPETDAEACESGPCGTHSFTDRCGTSRTADCDCPPNVCTPEPDDALCAAAQAECGAVSITDSCGSARQIDCDTCPRDETCTDNTCERCAPPSCPTTDSCGVVRNECGDEVACEGTCDVDSICIDNTCTAPFLAPPELQPGDRFGEELEAWSDLVAIGAPGSESVWVYQRRDWGWTQFQRLTAPRPGQGYGDRIAMNDQNLVVATDEELIVYHRELQGQFSPVGEVPVAGQVRDLSLEEDGRLLIGFEEAVVGEPTLFVATCGSTGCTLGTSWVREQTEEGRLGLGYAIDSIATFSLVGAPFDDIDPQNDPAPGGSAFFLSDVNETGTWRTSDWSDGPLYFRELSHLRVSGQAFAEGMGYSVALAENGLAAVGAPYDYPPVAFTESGSIYLLGKSTQSRWVRPIRFSGPASELFARCGHAVAIVGDSAVASCMYDGRRDSNLSPTEVAQTSGSFFRWDWNDEFAEWVLRNQPERAPNNTSFDHFGWSLEGTPTELYVGAPGRNSDAGQVWIYPEP